MVEVRHYTAPSGRDVFETWLASLKDKATEARIAARIDRLRAGNFGDCKPLIGGVWELRIDFGPGYRVYYAVISRGCVLLISGGDKRHQASDIAKAAEYLNEYKRRSTNR